VKKIGQVLQVRVIVGEIGSMTDYQVTSSACPKLVPLSVLNSY